MKNKITMISISAVTLFALSVGSLQATQGATSTKSASTVIDNIDDELVSYKI